MCRHQPCVYQTPAGTDLWMFRHGVLKQTDTRRSGMVETRVWCVVCAAEGNVEMRLHKAVFERGAGKGMHRRYRGCMGEAWGVVAGVHKCVDMARSARCFHHTLPTTSWLCKRGRPKPRSSPLLFEPLLNLLTHSICFSVIVSRFGACPLQSILGYFSIIILLHVHILLVASC